MNADGANDAPAPGEHDTTDWTFVLETGCPECGYTLHEPTTTAERLRADVPRWETVLARPNVAARPEPTVWSPLEYACHARDLIAVLGERVALMRGETDPVFADYDGEAEAVRGRFWAADPTKVAVQIRENTDATIAVLAVIDDWQRTGRRGDGKRFTIGQLCQYLLHDVEHHLHDVGG